MRALTVVFSVVALMSLALAACDPPTESVPAPDAGPDAGPSDAGTEDDAGETQADAGAEDAGTDAGPVVDAGPTEAAIDYCNCVFLSCHDAYHEVYGVDEDEAVDACRADGTATPETGESVDAGDSLQCRRYYCELPVDGGRDCESALGGGACQ